MIHDNNIRRAKVVRAVSSTSLNLDIDLGMGVTMRRRVTLARISPNPDKLYEAQTWLQGHFIVEVPDVTIKYDRHPDNADCTIVEVWDDLGENVSDFLITQDWAQLDERLIVRDLR